MSELNKVEISKSGNNNCNNNDKSNILLEDNDENEALKAKILAENTSSNAAVKSKPTFCDTSDQELYENFLKTMFECGTDDNTSVASTVEDEDDDYTPSQFDMQLENDDELLDLDTDDEMDKVDQKEVRDIVHGCFQIIANIHEDEHELVNISDVQEHNENRTGRSNYRGGQSTVGQELTSSSSSSSQQGSRSGVTTATTAAAVPVVHGGSAGGIIGSAIASAGGAFDTSDSINSSSNGSRAGVTTIGFHTNSNTSSAPSAGLSSSGTAGSHFDTSGASFVAAASGFKTTSTGVPVSSSSSTSASSSSTSNKRRMMHNVVNQLLSGSAPSSVVINDMPIEVMRSLVGRQMSMSLQLLIQLLLQCQLNESLAVNTNQAAAAAGGERVVNASGTTGFVGAAESSYIAGQVEAQCHKYFLELYNQKELAARRSKLTALSMRNVQRTLPRKMRRKLNHSTGPGGYNSQGYDGDAPGVGLYGYMGVDDDDERVVTRSHYNKPKPASCADSRSGGYGYVSTGDGGPDFDSEYDNASYSGNKNGWHRHGNNFSIFNAPLLRKYGNASSLFLNLDVHRSKLARQSMEALQERFTELSTNSNNSNSNSNSNRVNDCTGTAGSGNGSISPPAVKSKRDILFNLIHEYTKTFCVPPSVPTAGSIVPIPAEESLLGTSNVDGVPCGGSMALVETAENSNSCASFGSSAGSGAGGNVNSSSSSGRPSRFRRHWECLHPSENYPLAPSYIAQLYPAGGGGTGVDGAFCTSMITPLMGPSSSSALTDRCIFTPAEDDLLCKGVISTNLLSQSINRHYSQHSHIGHNGEGASAASEDWLKIVREYLPNKNQPILEHRYRMLMGTHGDDDDDDDDDSDGNNTTTTRNNNNSNNSNKVSNDVNKYLRNNQQTTRMTLESEALRFNKCVKLAQTKHPRHNKFTLAEDVQLLKGYHAFCGNVPGNKDGPYYFNGHRDSGSMKDHWSKISMCFLCHRTPRECRSRWCSLQRDWMKAQKCNQEYQLSSSAAVARKKAGTHYVGSNVLTKQGTKVDGSLISSLLLFLRDISDHHPHGTGQGRSQNRSQSQSQNQSQDRNQNQVSVGDINTTGQISVNSAMAGGSGTTGLQQHQQMLQLGGLSSSRSSSSGMGMFSSYSTLQQVTPLNRHGLLKEQQQEQQEQQEQYDDVQEDFICSTAHDTDITASTAVSVVGSMRQESSIGNNFLPCGNSIHNNSNETLQELEQGEPFIEEDELSDSSDEEDEVEEEKKEVVVVKIGEGGDEVQNPLESLELREPQGQLGGISGLDLAVQYLQQRDKSFLEQKKVKKLLDQVHAYSTDLASAAVNSNSNTNTNKETNKQGEGEEKGGSYDNRTDESTASQDQDKNQDIDADADAVAVAVADADADADDDEGIGQDVDDDEHNFYPDESVADDEIDNDMAFSNVAFLMGELFGIHSSSSQKNNSDPLMCDNDCDRGSGRTGNSGANRAAAGDDSSNRPKSNDKSISFDSDHATGDTAGKKRRNTADGSNPKKSKNPKKPKKVKKVNVSRLLKQLNSIHRDAPEARRKYVDIGVNYLPIPTISGNLSSQTGYVPPVVSVRGLNNVLNTPNRTSAGVIGAGISSLDYGNFHSDHHFDYNPNAVNGTGIDVCAVMSSAGQNLAPLVTHSDGGNSCVGTVCLNTTAANTSGNSSAGHATKTDRDTIQLCTPIATSNTTTTPTSVMINSGLMMINNNKRPSSGGLFQSVMNATAKADANLNTVAVASLKQQYPM